MRNLSLDFFLATYGGVIKNTRKDIVGLFPRFRSRVSSCLADLDNIQTINYSNTLGGGGGGATRLGSAPGDPFQKKKKRAHVVEKDRCEKDRCEDLFFARQQQFPRKSQKVEFILPACSWPAPTRRAA